MRYCGQSIALKEDPRILIVRLSAIGDVIHALPCLDALRRRYPKAHIGWVVEELSRELLEGHPQLDEVFVIPKKRWRGSFRRNFLPEVRPFYREIQRRKFDIAIDFQGLTKSGLWTWLSGAKTRIGLAGKDCREINGWFTNLKVDPDSVNPQGPIEHIIERNLSLLRPLGIEGQRSGAGGQGTGGGGGSASLDQSDRPDLSDQPDIAHSQQSPPRKPKTENRDPETENRKPVYSRMLPDHPEWHVVIDGWLRQEGLPLDARFVALNPGAGWETKRWPEERFTELGVWLVREMQRNVMIMWGPPEEAMARQIHGRITAQVSGSARSSAASVFMAPRLSVGQSIEMTRRCDLFIGGDTGPTHLAAALDIPVVAIFGGSDARRNHPGGRRQVILQKLEACPMAPCWKTRPPEGCQGLRCLREIGVEDVMLAIRKLLN